MTDTPPSDGPSQGADFDMMGALDWKDGIATLPGSDIRFRMTEFGTLEIVTDVEVKGQEAAPKSGTLDPTSSHSPTPPPESQSQTGTAVTLMNKLQTVSTQGPTLPSSEEGPSTRDPKVEIGPCVGPGVLLGPNHELAKCQACGVLVALDVLFQGKFCSSLCAQPSSGRSSPGEARDALTAEGEKLGKRVRKKRKIYMDSGDEEEEMEEPEEKTKSNKGRRCTKVAKIGAAPGNKKRAWSWPAYLEEEKAVAAPVKLFKEHQSFPQSRNSFKVGMKLEGLDPCHPSLFCVLSVAEIQGYRVRLHFDGYPECYDFWANADSWDLKPAGWCEKNGHKLLLPKGCKEGEFNWSMYVKNCRGQLAPKHLFKSLNTSVTPSGFRAGMKLEAIDRKNPSLICVATIAAVVDNRLLIHFDNWDDTYDYWCDASSPYIHPVGYCEEAELTLTTPAGKTQTKTHVEYKHPKSFSWEKYLEETGSQAAPARAFKPRPPHGFQIGMRVEAVDKRNPVLIRIATIADTEDHRLKIHFDGWSSEYDYWVETDCPDLHPPGWCQKTGHPLQCPNGSTELLSALGQGCPTPGCNGVGHIRGPRYGTHYTQVSCPYSEINLNKEGLVPDRLSGERPMTLSGPLVRVRRPDPSLNTTAHTSQTPDRLEALDDVQNRKQVNVEAESSGRNGHLEPAGGPNEQMQIINRLKRSGHPPKYLKMHVKQEAGDVSPDSISLQQALHESVFPPSISAASHHRVALCWDKHCQLLPEVLGLSAKRVAAWSVEEVAGFVKGLPGCKEHAATFKTEQIDGEAFLLLTQTDIVKILSIKLGPALKIYNSILMLKSADEE
ncbi:lethal(3)malignant brain tumor-like protein 4 isoform X1 [Synchiropus splendidus]|uniref:lethal(3)malignant brain tumor-like protein 4 isoform X1 n=1 Tax=Synchiropus splendidus TaxID=270530 RepID=UPI00237DF3C3|nr:lethal(3)malignant brain tumor-like protein 4 isoform X1 [Synchiropus splendidus]XP_053743439.1 lethal(3)malignant brain tumor-like protein 4 isoform X1 [Synchiropus splendidus]XP_053743440.1 lethal(3)malignant brain tumor-like protein 4 isoform X1 [Synchiropus splendidus]XP_053743441.1 lethal(3)malignant brain tumor-like protein 4 isoform X1 [Synchiropus splendidus]XP_053743442.1 lethal(3)malignant brain tumor-like protein 4 isoform X1 [Synchiropus splendidus]